MFTHLVNHSIRLAYASWVLSLAVSTCSATPTNVTIDDQTGDAISGLLPNYSPSIAWNQGAGCDFCAAKPNASDAGGGTWHDASYNPGVYPEQFGVTLQFNGTAIWMFNILQQLTFTSLNFTLDGEDAGSFIWDNASSFEFLYNQSIFQRDGLQQGPHTLVATVSGSNQSLILFDYAIYTTDTDAITPPSSPSSAPATSHSTPVGAIVGGVVGGIAAISLVLIAFLCYRRRQRTKAGLRTSTTHTSISPFTSDTLSPEPSSTTKASFASLGQPLATYRPARYHESSGPVLSESSHLPLSPPSRLAPLSDAPIPSSHIAPSVLDIHAGTRTMATTPMGALSTTSSERDRERERQLEDEVERLRTEMREMRAGKVREKLPGYESSGDDVLIHREP